MRKRKQERSTSEEGAPRGKRKYRCGTDRLMRRGGAACASHGSLFVRTPLSLIKYKMFTRCQSLLLAKVPFHHTEERGRALTTNDEEFRFIDEGRQQHALCCCCYYDSQIYSISFLVGCWLVGFFLVVTTKHGYLIAFQSGVVCVCV